MFVRVCLCAKPELNPARTPAKASPNCETDCHPVPGLARCKTGIFPVHGDSRLETLGTFTRRVSLRPLTLSSLSYLRDFAPSNTRARRQKQVPGESAAAESKASPSASVVMLQQAQLTERNMDSKYQYQARADPSRVFQTSFLKSHCTCLAHVCEEVLHQTITKLQHFEMYLMRAD